jgi:hypothetical protein
MKWFQKIISYIAPTFTLKRSPTVRYAFSFLVLIALIAGFASVVGSTQSEIVLETNNAAIAEGETFMVDVYAVAKTPVNAVSLRVAFPTEHMEVLGIDKGQSVITLWANDPSVNNGVVTLEGGTFRKGFVGKHLIATINVKAKSLGQASIITQSANLLAGDGKGTELRTNIDTNGKKVVTIGDASGETITGEAVVVLVTDVNGDTKITLADISAFMTEWVKQNNRYDFNDDGLMTFRDFSILLASYFKAN